MKNIIEFKNFRQNNKIYNIISYNKFYCCFCGLCCKYNSKKDNTVYIRYDEILNITKAFNVPFKSVVDPFLPDFIRYINKKNIYKSIKKYLKSINEQIDEDGYIHAFGWKLKRNNNGNCIFYDSLFKKCKIYKYRPSLCCTYPFYIDIETFNIEICSCPCISQNENNIYIHKQKIEEQVMNLIERCINDLNDLNLIKNNTKIITKTKKLNSKKGLLKAYEHFINGHLNIIVYDQNSVSFFRLLIPKSIA